MTECVYERKWSQVKTSSWYRLDRKKICKVILFLFFFPYFFFFSFLFYFSFFLKNRQRVNVWELSYGLSDIVKNQRHVFEWSRGISWSQRIIIQNGGEPEIKKQNYWFVYQFLVTSLSLQTMEFKPSSNTESKSNCYNSAGFHWIRTSCWRRSVR